MSSKSIDTKLNHRILRLIDVVRITGIPRSSIYHLIELGTFPSYIKIGERSSGWLEHEIQAWIEQRIIERDQASGEQEECKRAQTKPLPLFRWI